MASDYDSRLTPTVDRIDNTLGYLLANIQFLSRRENIAKGNRERRGIRHKPTNAKKVGLIKGDKVLHFMSAKKACDFLGVSRTAVHVAMKQRTLVRGWKPCHVN